MGSCVKGFLTRRCCSTQSEQFARMEQFFDGAFECVLDRVDFVLRRGVCQKEFLCQHASATTKEHGVGHAGDFENGSEMQSRFYRVSKTKKGFVKVGTKTRDSQTMSPTLTPPPMKAAAHYSTPSPFATPTSPPPVVRQNATAARPDRAVSRVLFPTQPTHVVEAETDTDAASDTA